MDLAAAGVAKARRLDEDGHKNVLADAGILD
jgi:hypothetical protein